MGSSASNAGGQAVDLAGRVQVWRIDLRDPVARQPRLAELLAADECARAARYRFPGLATRFVAGRVALRCILGRYLGLDAQAVRLTYTANGKPGLADPETAAGRIHFNLSHAQDLALCAVTLQQRVGVDVEYLHRRVTLDSIATRFFSPRECAVLQDLPPTERRQAFFRFWTCKEACIKATGQGLSQLEEVEVDLGAEPSARVQFTGCWNIHEMTPAADYVAAVAVEGSAKGIEVRDFAWHPVSV